MSAFDHDDASASKTPSLPTTTTHVGGSYYKSKDIVQCAIALDDGSDELSVHYSPSSDLAEAIEKADGLEVIMDGLIDPDDEDHKLPHDKNKVPWLIIKPDDIPVTVNKSRSVALCAFHATDTFMKHWTMGSLDSDDQDWYKMHHLVTEDGLPQQHTFTVLQQLVEPYGLGIDRICVPQNSRRFNEYTTFIEALGSNPFFRMDGHTTNEEALEKIFSDPNMKKMSKQKKQETRESLLAGWRFECSDVPFTGAIIMTQFQTSSVGHNGASSYKGPRSKTHPDSWRMAIKLNRLADIKYQQPLELTEYQEHEGTIRYDFWKIQDKNGKTLRDIADDIRKEKYPHAYSNRTWDKPSEAVKPLGAHLPPQIPSSSQSSNNDDREPKSWESNTESGITDKHWSSKTPETGLSYPAICKVCKGAVGLFFQAGVRHCSRCNAKLEKDYIHHHGETPDHREFDDPVSTLKREWAGAMPPALPQDNKLVSPDQLSDAELMTLFVNGGLGTKR